MPMPSDETWHNELDRLALSIIDEPGIRLPDAKAPNAEWTESVTKAIELRLAKRTYH